MQVPEVHDHTPNTALLLAEIEGDEIVVDFIDHVFGVRDRDAKKMVAIVSLPMAQEKKKVDVAISIMHPIHCLMSKAANALSPALKRRDETAMRQLNAAVYVLSEFLNDLLKHDEHGRASKILKMLYRYLRSDIYGRHVHSLTDKDPLEILREFSQDTRLHPKFRPHLAIWLREIEGRRKNRELRRRRHA